MATLLLCILFGVPLLAQESAGLDVPEAAHPSRLGDAALDDAIGFRLAREFLPVDSSGLRARLKSGDATAAKISYSLLVAPIGASCGSAVGPSAIWATVRSALPSWMEEVPPTRSTHPASPATDVPDIELRVRGIDCALSVEAIAEEQVPSTYVSRHESMVNPAYLRAMDRMRITEYGKATAAAKNDPPARNLLSGFALGALTGFTGAKLAAALQGSEVTQPMSSRPVYSAYLATRITFRQEARISASFQIIDRSSGATDEVLVAGTATRQAQGMRGVFPTDPSGLRNYETSFSSGHGLLTDAALALGIDLRSSLRSLGERLR